VELSHESKPASNSSGVENATNASKKGNLTSQHLDAAPANGAKTDDPFANLKLIQKEENPAKSAGQAAIEIGIQLVFLLIFFKTVAEKYPQLSVPNDKSKLIMSEPVAFRCKGGPICLTAFCCPSLLMALTAAKTGVLDYWPMGIAGICCPCCMQMWLLNMTDFKERLGGEKDTLMDACGISCCCLCCSLARNVEALDAATGSETGCFSVSVGDEGGKDGNAPQ
jgi:hypothetical protein